jgi:hypothetical protein
MPWRTCKRAPKPGRKWWTIVCGIWEGTMSGLGRTWAQLKTSFDGTWHVGKLVAGELEGSVLAAREAAQLSDWRSRRTRRDALARAHRDTMAAKEQLERNDEL